jgi:transcriptional regulator with XRE-family HTH domain
VVGSGKNALALPKLREYRVHAGLTQAELAEMVGVSPHTISGYESGENARPRYARRIADVLGTTTWELSGYEAPKVQARLLAEKVLRERAGSSYLAREAHEIKLAGETTTVRGLKEMLTALGTEREKISELLTEGLSYVRDRVLDHVNGDVDGPAFQATYESVKDELGRMRRQFKRALLILVAIGDERFVASDDREFLDEQRRIAESVA